MTFHAEKVLEATRKFSVFVENEIKSAQEKVDPDDLAMTQVVAEELEQRLAEYHKALTERFRENNILK